VLFDIGACVGLVSVHAAMTGARVVAFEPEPQFRMRLMQNLRLNRLQDEVRVIDWAVSDAAGETELFTDGVAGLSPSLKRVGERGTITIRTDSIDNALARDELPRPSVIKLDIEGAETLALRGMRSLLTSPDAPRAIFIELHPDFLPGFGSTLDEATSLIASAGYRVAHDEQRADQIHRVYRK
jgi:FkbM family methyltransferase